MNNQDEPYVDITIGQTSVKVIGTAHVSKKSKAIVAQEINSQKYDCVAVELCDTRLEQIKNPDFVANSDIFNIIKAKKVSTFIIMLAMSAMQNRIAKNLGVELGLDMKEAVALANQNKLGLVPIDRGVSITFARLTQNMGFLNRLKLLFDIATSIFEEKSVSADEIESLKSTGALENIITQISDDAPLLHQFLILERDRYMSLKLSELASRYDSILAVVGAAHLKGIKSNLKEMESKETKSNELALLNNISKRSSFIQFFPYLILVIIIFGFVYGFYQSPELGIDIVKDWVLINGGLSAFFVLISRGHPLSVIVGFLAAPLTSLNPTVGAGMVVGLIEAWLRKPKIYDFMKLKEDTGSLKGWFSNNVTRVLIVSFMAGFGSALGTYIAGYHIYGKLF
ncbi:MAG: hypothetical protein CBC29_03765 [Methylococcaceae bacterium TMED69]|nr:MAG: hypothetical protein CBC29_03765 [Methylococcaceae bacterium TMED69]|tara:strand:+ start:434 stop:1624 length:1191 start_codon:yes stop_codon:yes gene_type:complete